jgi:hypothetical protein
LRIKFLRCALVCAAIDVSVVCCGHCGPFLLYIHTRGSHVAVTCLGSNGVLVWLPPAGEHLEVRRFQHYSIHAAKQFTWLEHIRFSKML